MHDGESEHVVGEVYTERVLRPSKASTYRASSMDVEGVEKVVLLEVSGTHDGRPYKVAIEFALEDGSTIGKSMVELADNAARDL